MVNGFLKPFVCPKHYNGLTCQEKPLCRLPEDANTIKPLSRDLFARLTSSHTDFEGRLQEIHLSAAYDARANLLDAERHSSRVRIACNERGEATLERCPTTYRLNEQLQCEPITDSCYNKPRGEVFTTRTAASHEFFECDGQGQSIRRSCMEKYGGDIDDDAITYEFDPLS